MTAWLPRVFCKVLGYSALTRQIGVSLGPSHRMQLVQATNVDNEVYDEMTVSFGILPLTN